MERSYFKKVHRNEITAKDTAKRLSVLTHQKNININKGQSDHDFLSFKNASEEAR